MLGWLVEREIDPYIPVWNLARRLMTVPGVGLIVALNFIATVAMPAVLPRRPMLAPIWASRRDAMAAGLAGH